MGGMASAAANDFKIGVGLKDDVEGNDPQLDGGLTGYQRRTQQRKKREADAIRDFQLLRNDDPPASQPAPARAAPATNYSAASVAPVAPTVPDPDEIGDTEQALLDQQKKGRSSTIATSSRGLLSGEDDTSKKRSLMGSLIT